MPALLRYTHIGPELQPRSVNAIYCTWECPLYHLTDKRRRITPKSPPLRSPLDFGDHKRWICPTDLLDAPPQTTKSCLLQVASSTGGREARNKPVAQVLVTAKRVRNSRLYIWESGSLQMLSKMSTRRARIRAAKWPAASMTFSR
jgi:hypothetical protein